MEIRWLVFRAWLAFRRDIPFSLDVYANLLRVGIEPEALWEAFEDLVI